MLSPKQSSLYWRTWGALCTEHGWKNSDSERRHAIHAQAKCPASMRDFTNADFDKFLGLCRRLMGEAKDPACSAEDGERRRLLWRIRQDAKTAGLDAAYLNKLATDLYGLSCWDELCLADLTNFRDAIHNRAGKRIGHDTRSVERPVRRMTLDPAKSFTPAPARELAHASDPF